MIRELIDLEQHIAACEFGEGHLIDTGSVKEIKFRGRVLVYRAVKTTRGHHSIIVFGHKASRTYTPKTITRQLRLD